MMLTTLLVATSALFLALLLRCWLWSDEPPIEGREQAPPGADLPGGEVTFTARPPIEQHPPPKMLAP